MTSVEVRWFTFVANTQKVRSVKFAQRVRMRDLSRLMKSALSHLRDLIERQTNSSGECYTQTVKVDEQVTLLGGIQVHLKARPTTYFLCVYGE